MLPFNLKNYMQTYNNELYHYGILSTVPGAVI